MPLFCEFMVVEPPPTPHLQNGCIGLLLQSFIKCIKICKDLKLTKWSVMFTDFVATATTENSQNTHIFEVMCNTQTLHVGLQKILGYNLQSIFFIY